MKLTRVWMGLVLGVALLSGYAGPAPPVEPVATPDHAVLMARLDDLAKTKFKLQVPAPTQVVLLSDG